MKPKITELKRRLNEISHLNSILQLALWDQEVNMPTKATDARAESISHLATLIHNKFVSIDHDGLLTKLIKVSDAVIISETWRTYNRERKLPADFVRKLSETCSKSQSVWAEARKKNDFKLFLPWLKKIVDLKRQEAKYVGFTESPYDALLDMYEPGMTAKKTEVIFTDLKKLLIPLLKKIKASKNKTNETNADKTKGYFPIEAQKKWNTFMSKSIGFDFEAGKIDVSTHPFASGLHPNDVRFTTRYREDDLLYSIGSTIHETGHGLYEQGLPVEHFGTPLCESISLGIHESQSRMWENIIGKSKSFWKYFYPKLQREFPDPFQKIDLEEFHKIINIVNPSLIRTEADEVTYNLHVILRFEIEKAMIEGTIKLENLPKIWKSKMKEYLGINVSNDTQGVLQDVHWSMGGIGYFPTYSFGNLYSAQFFSAMKRDMPDIENKISSGNFREINKWLRKNIHCHGKTHTAENLVKRVTGENLNSKYFKKYIENKYDTIK